MNDTHSTIKCKNCRDTFQPDMHTKGAWLCPNCQVKNPNLRLHYRSVAGLCILGFIVTAIAAVVAFRQAGMTVGIALSTAHAGLLLLTTVFVYRSQTPWADAPVRALLWTVFGLAVILSIVIPLVLAGVLNIAPLILYALAFPYLFWVDGHARRSTTRRSTHMPQGNNPTE